MIVSKYKACYVQYKIGISFPCVGGISTISTSIYKEFLLGFPHTKYNSIHDIWLER